MQYTTRVIRCVGLLWMWVMLTDSVYAFGLQTDTLRQDTLPQRLLSLKGAIVGGVEKELLPGAYIYLGERKTAIMTTDNKGEFLIPKIPAGKIRLSVSYTGYQEFSKDYDLQKDLDIGEIRLEPVILDEVVIEATPPLAVQHGDTTQFNASAVKVRLDADLEDLLKKLPGFEIVDGKIMAQGKEVTKLYIDGMEYSFNDPAAALKNLPAKLVAKIQMYDDRSEEAKFSGYDDGQKFRSLNIETPHPNKVKIFGQGRAGYGITAPLENTFDENNYEGAFSANLFDKKRKITVSGDIRNLGQSNDLPGSRYQGKGGDNNSKGIYTNFSSTFGKNWMFSGNYHYSDRNSYSGFLSRQVYFPTERYDNRLYDQESHSWNEGRDQNVNIHTDIKLNEKNKITFSPVLTMGRQTGHSLNMGGNIENNDTVNVSHTENWDKSDHLNFHGDFAWMHAFTKKGRTLTLRMNGDYSRNLSDQEQNNEESTWNTEKERTDTLRNLLTNNHRTGYEWEAMMVWSEPFTEHARMALSYACRENVSNADKESLSFRDREFKELIGVDSAQTNRLKNTYRIHRYGLNYNYFFKKLRFNGGLAVSHTEMKNLYRYLGTTDSVVRSAYTDLSPVMNFGVQTSKNSNLDIRYNGSSSSPNSTQLQDVLEVTNPLQISKGNPDLKKSFTHNLYLNYTCSRPEKSFFSSFFFNAGQTFNQIASNVKFIQRDTVINDYTVLRGARFTMPVNLNGSWNVAANFNCSFPLGKKLRFNTSMYYSFLHTPSIYDDLKNMTDAHNGRLGFSLSSNISEHLDFNLSSSSSYSYSRNTTTGSSQYFSENVNAFVNWFFWKSLFVRGDYNGSFYVNKKGEKVNQAKHILNLGLGKKFGKDGRMEISLAASDILNEQNSVDYSLNDLYSETSCRTMSSSYYMLSFSYRFNNIDQLKNRSH